MNHKIFLSLQVALLGIFVNTPHSIVAAPVAVQQIAAPNTVSPNGINYSGIDFSAPYNSGSGEIFFQDSSAGQIAGLTGSLASINFTTSPVAGLTLGAGETLAAVPRLIWRSPTPNQYFALATINASGFNNMALVSGTPGAFTKVLRLNETLPGTSAVWAATRFSPTIFVQENLPTTSNGSPMIKAVTPDDSAAYIGVYRNGAWENTQVVGINAPGFAAGTSLRISGLNVRSGNAAGQFVFDTFTYVNNAADRNVVYVGQNGALQLVVKSRDVLAGDPRLIGGTLMPGSINATGTLAFTGSYLDGSGGFVYRWNATGGATKVISQGDPIPSIGPRAIFQNSLGFQIPLTNDSGAVVFMADVLLDPRDSNSKRTALLYQAVAGGPIVKLALSGDRIDGLPEGTVAFIDLGSVVNFNNAGHVMLVGNTKANSVASGRSGGVATFIAGGLAPNLSIVAREDSPLSVEGISGSSRLLGLTRPGVGITNSYNRVSGQAEAILSDAGAIAFRGTLPGGFFGQSSVFQARLGVAPTATLSAQHIKFPQPFTRRAVAGTLTLSATSSSGLPVTYALVSGPATVTGNVVNFSGIAGDVVIRASQAGNGSFLAAEMIDRTILVTSDASKFPPQGIASITPLVLPLTSGPDSMYSGINRFGTVMFPNGDINFKDVLTNDVVLRNGTAFRLNFSSVTTSGVTIPSGKILDTARTTLLNINATNQALVSTFIAAPAINEEATRVLATGTPGNFTKLLQTGDILPGTSSVFSPLPTPGSGEPLYISRGGLPVVIATAPNQLSNHLGIYRNGTWEKTQIIGLTPPGYSSTVKFGIPTFRTANAAGEFLFRSSPVSGFTTFSEGLFYGKNGSLLRIATVGAGSSLPGDTRVLSSLDSNSLNSSGEAALYGNYSSGGFIYRWSATAGASSVLKRGDLLTVLGPNIIFDQLQRAPIINDTGGIFMFASILDRNPTTQAVSNPRQAFLYQANRSAAIEKILMTGEIIPGAPAGFGNFFSSINSITSIQINNSGHVAIFARTSSAVSGYDIVYGGMLPNLNFVMKSGWLDIPEVGTQSVTFSGGTSLDQVTGDPSAMLSEAGDFIFQSNYSNFGLNSGETGIFRVNVVTAPPVPVAQSITFPIPADRLISSSAFNLGATSDSGLPITYQLVSGPATLNGSTLTPGSTTGLITVRATQAGDSFFLAATAVERSFRLVANASELAMSNYLANRNVPASDRLPTLDLDHDGMMNLLEFALGGNPLQADLQRLPAVTLSNGILRFTYTRAQTSSVIYTVKGSVDLNAAWSSAGITQGTPDFVGVTTATLPMALANSAFLRLEVSLAP